MIRRSILSFCLIIVVLTGGLTAQEAKKKRPELIRAMPKPGTSVEFVEQTRHELVSDLSGTTSFTVVLAEAAYSLSVVKSKTGGQRIMSMRFGPSSVCLFSANGAARVEATDDPTKLTRLKQMAVRFVFPHRMLENRTFEFRRDASNRILDLTELPRAEGAPAPAVLPGADEATIQRAAMLLISDRLLAVETRAMREGRARKKKLRVGGVTVLDAVSNVESHDAKRLVTKLAGNATRKELMNEGVDETDELTPAIRASRDFSMRYEGEATISRADGLVVSSRRCLEMTVDRGKDGRFATSATTMTMRGRHEGPLAGVSDQDLLRGGSIAPALDPEVKKYIEERGVIVDLIPSDDRQLSRDGKGSRIVVMGRSVSLADLRAVLKVAGPVNANRRDSQIPRASGSELFLRCHGRQSIGLVKVVMEMCLDPEIVIYKQRFALTGGKCLLNYRPLHLVQGAADFDELPPVVIEIARDTAKSGNGKGVALRYGVNGVAVPGTGSAARIELRKRLKSAMAESVPGHEVFQFDVDDNVTMQEWLDTLELGVLAGSWNNPVLWFKAFRNKRMLFLRRKPVSDLQLEVWSKALLIRP